MKSSLSIDRHGAGENRQVSLLCCKSACLLLLCNYNHQNFVVDFILWILWVSAAHESTTPINYENCSLYTHYDNP